MFDIFGSIFRLFEMAFEPLWRAMRLDFGLGWTPPPPAPTPAWVALLSGGGFDTIGGADAGKGCHHSRCQIGLRGEYWLSSTGCVLTHNNNVSEKCQT